MPNVTEGNGALTLFLLDSDPRLLNYILEGEIDPSFVITHRLPLGDAPKAYKTFQEKEDHCIKVVMKPGMAESTEEVMVGVEALEPSSAA